MTDRLRLNEKSVTSPSYSPNRTKIRNSIEYFVFLLVHIQLLLPVLLYHFPSLPFDSSFFPSRRLVGKEVHMSTRRFYYTENYNLIFKNSSFWKKVWYVFKSCLNFNANWW